ncbi:5-hydroxytryptamine receptor 1F-like [Paramacrobiotus metropolitanus]|uniref:5-hydroxytryptamine receptor 1F-like n=1 Tax=Paramacrobiotus metropolitanus TaxID=2943436 RepID=UPI0024464B2A|nr:5-hydroxytryptamine receptor 1F-like [Paramacrobiotus metropolitanus]
MTPTNNSTTLFDARPLRCDTVESDERAIRYLSSIYLIMGPVFLALCALAFLGNALILSTVFFIRKKQLTPTLMFSLSLAAADAVAAAAMGVGILVNNILFWNIHVDMEYRACIQFVVEALRLSGMVCSALHFMALAINHWMGITKPLHYASRMTRQNAAICIAVMWILPDVIFFIYFVSIPDEGFRSPYCQRDDFAHKFAFRFFVSALFFAPLILMSVVYFHVFLEIHLHQKKLSTLDCSAANYNTNNVSSSGGSVSVSGSMSVTASQLASTERSYRDEKRRMASNTRALITTLIILFVYLIGWLPAVINYLLVCYDCVIPLSISLCIRLPTNIIVNLLILLKFLVYPIIYTARIREIRTVVTYYCVKLGCRKPASHPRSFDRFDISRTGSFMTSLRYSTYRSPRKGSDASTSPSMVTRRSSATQVYGARKGPYLDILHATTPNGTGPRRASNGSLGRPDKPGYLPYPTQSPLLEVNESLSSPTSERRELSSM